DQPAAVDQADREYLGQLDIIELVLWVPVLEFAPEGRAPDHTRSGRHRQGEAHRTAILLRAKVLGKPRADLLRALRGNCSSGPRGNWNCRALGFGFITENPVDDPAPAHV